MEKYLEIHTWNGDGYSDSHARILDLSEADASGYLRNLHNQFAIFYSRCTIEGNELHYGEGEDDGIVTLLEYHDELVGVILEPLVNDYKLYYNESDYLEKIDEMRDELLEYQDEENVFDCVDNYYLTFDKNKLNNNG